MKVALLGSGGREHAMAWKISESHKVQELIVIPGSDAIDKLPKTKCISGDAVMIAKDNDNDIDLVVVGPEQPLVEGIVDLLEAEGIKVFGPSKAAAMLESSKVFAKRFMAQRSIPTADFVVCESYDKAKEVLSKWRVEDEGVVIKADELAGGKGVVVTHDRAEAEKTIYDFMQNPDCSVHTSELLLEKKLVGKEVSAFAICDGDSYIMLGYACDYKRVGDNDVGANTGGMGGYSPKGWPSDAVKKLVEKQVVQNTLDGMKSDGKPFKGILFVGLMVDGDEANVIEFNVRLGDPETQILLPLIDGDIVPVLEKAAEGKLSEVKSSISLKNETSVHVVMTSGGYPTIDKNEKMDLGKAITFPQAMNDDCLLFIAGAKFENDIWINSGGRVLGVTALGSDVEDAREKAYQEIEKISFEKAHWRTDIGK